MMRLRKIVTGRWTVACEVDDRGNAAVFNELSALWSNRSTKGVAAGFRAQFTQIPPQGPTYLPDVIYHCVDPANGIYEFIKGRYRILCFAVEGRVVVCSTVFLKQTRKTPDAEKNRAIDLKRRYLAAVAGSAIEWVD